MASYAAGYRLYFGNLSCRYRRLQAVPCPVPGQTVQYIRKLTDIYISHTGRPPVSFSGRWLGFLDWGVGHGVGIRQ